MAMTSRLLLLAIALVPLMLAAEPDDTQAQAATLDSGELAPALDQLQAKLQALKSGIVALKEKGVGLRARQAQDGASDTALQANAEDAAARRTAVEARVEELEHRVENEKRASAKRMVSIQTRINQQIANRKDMVEQHDQALAAKQAAMEKKLVNLNHQNEREDALLAEQLGRVKSNKHKLANMSSQILHLESLATETQEVGDVLKHKYAAGLIEAEKNIAIQKKRLQTEQLRLPKLKKETDMIGRQIDPIRERSKKLRAKALAAETQAAAEAKRVAATASAKADSDQRLAHAELKKSKLQQESQETEHQLQSTRATNVLRGRQVTLLNQKIEHQQDVIQDLKDQAQLTTSDLRSTQDQISQVQSKINKADTATAKWKKVGAMLTASIDKLHTLASDSTSKKEAEQADIGRLTRKMEQMKKEYESSSKQLAKKKAQLSDLMEQQNSDRDTTQETELRSQLERLSQQSRLVSARGSQASKQLAQLKEKYSYLESVKHKQDQTSSTAQQNFELESSKLHAQISHSKDQIADLKLQIGQRTQALHRLQKSTQDESDSKASSFKKTVDQLHREIETLEAKTLETAKKSGLLMQLSEEKNKKVISLGKAKQLELESKEAALSKELASRKKQIAEMTDTEGKSLDTRKAELATLQQTIRDLQEEESRVETELAQLNAQRDSLKQELQAVEDKAAETLKWKMKAAHQVVKEKQATLTLEKMKSLKRERIIQVLQSKLQEYQDSVKTLTKQLDDFNTKKQELETSIQRRQTKIKATQHKLDAKTQAVDKLSRETRAATQQVAAEEAALDKETAPLAEAAAKERKEAAVGVVKQHQAADQAAEIGALTAKLDKLEATDKSVKSQLGRTGAANKKLERNLKAADHKMKTDQQQESHAKKKLGQVKAKAKAQAEQVQADAAKVAAEEEQSSKLKAQIDADSTSVDQQKQDQQRVKAAADAAEQEQLARLDDQKRAQLQLGQVQETQARIKAEIAAQKKQALSDKRVEVMESSKLADSQASLQAVRQANALQAKTQAKTKAELKKLTAEERAALAEQGSLEGQIHVQKQVLEDAEAELESSSSKLAAEQADSKAERKASQDQLGQEAAALEKQKQKALKLEASKEAMSEQVADLKLQASRLTKQEQKAQADKLGAETQLEAVESKKAGLKNKLERREAALHRHEAKVQLQNKILQQTQSQEEKIKAKLLAERLEVQGKFNQVALDKQTLDGTKQDLNQIQTELDKAEMKISQQDSQLQAKQAEVQQLKEQANAAADPPALDQAKAEATDVEQEKSKKVVQLQQAQSSILGLTQEQNALSEKLKALGAKKLRVEATKKEELKKEDEDKAQFVAEVKKNQALKNVETSWQSTVHKNQAEAVETESNKAEVEHELATLKAEQLQAAQRQSEIQMQKEHKVRKLEQAVNAVSNRLKLSKHEQAVVKRTEQQEKEDLVQRAAEIKHEDREIDELSERKRMLIQSKLDDLEKKQAPFHDQGAEAMDKMEEANNLRSKDLQKTEAAVKAATEAAEPAR